MKYLITSRITQRMESIDRTRWLFDRVLIMPKYQLWIERDVLVRRASATTRIEGASLDEAAVSDLMKKKPLGKLSKDEIENLNAIQAYELVDYLSDVPDLRIDELVIREINRQFTRDVPESRDPGLYRNGRNTVGQFMPPNQGDVPALMREFGIWLRRKQKIHPIIKAGLAHIHLVAIHPFWDGNGRTARALATLILQRSEYGFRKLLSLESFYFRFREERYFPAIEATLGTNFIPNYDATPWLEFFCQSLDIHTEELADSLTDWRRQLDEIHRDLRGEGLLERQADGLVYATRMGQISRRDYSEIASVSGVTASRDLQILVEKGWLTPFGRGRGRKYLFRRRGEPEEAPREIPEEQLALPLESQSG